MAKRKKSDYTLEEILTLSNEELKSNWSKLASLIRLYEYGDEQNSNQKNTWYPSRAKAIQLLENKTADEYIDRVRSNPNQWWRSKPDEIKSVPIQAELVKPKFKPQSKKARPRQNVYQKNYGLLTTLIPDLEQRILDDKIIEGLSNLIGYHGVVQVKSIHNDKKQSILHLIHHIEEGATYREETMIALRLNLIKMTVEPLVFNNRDGYRRVYHKKDNYKRELVDIEEQKIQNRLLSDWLRSLIQYKHEFTWQDDPNSQDGIYLRIMGLNQSDDQEFVPIEPETADEKLKLEDLNEIISGVVNKQTQIERKIEEQEERQRIEIEQRERIQQEEFKRIVFERQEEQIDNEIPSPESKKNQSIGAHNMIDKPLDWKDRINDEIPDFEVGNVSLVQAHVKVGVQQRDIDWINKHRQGLVFTPKRDAKVKRHGFRISAVGKVSYEGRSKRKDG
jgi:hypothetical protein